MTGVMTNAIRGAPLASRPGLYCTYDRHNNFALRRWTGVRWVKADGTEIPADNVPVTFRGLAKRPRKGDFIWRSDYPEMGPNGGRSIMAYRWIGKVLGQGVSIIEE